MNEMTAEEAVKILKYERDNDIFVATEYREKLHEALTKAIKALEQQPCEDCISRQAVIILIDEASEMHPYKVVGDSDTYSNYNQGWSDACDWLYANIEGVPSVKPQTVTEFADKCKECGKIQNELSKDAVSRKAVIRLVEQYPNIIGNRCSGLIADIKHLPSVIPQYTDEEIDRTQAVEQAYVDKMVELTVEELRREWLNSFDTSSATKCFEAVNVLKERLEHEEI